MLRKTLLILTLLMCGSAAQAALNPMAGDTVTMRLLRYASLDAEKAAKDNGAQTFNYDIKVGGQTHQFKSLSIEGYMTDFKATGGRIMKSLGLDFSFALGKNNGRFTFDHPIFLVYNAVLVFMIGLYWFSMMSNTAKGKGEFEIIPLALKLMMGLIVVYNMPFVYGVAMTLKDLGMRIVTYAMTDGSDGPNPVAQNLSFASFGPLENNSDRDQGLREGLLNTLKKPLNMPPLVYIPPSAEVSKMDEKASAEYWQKLGINSGRVRLAILVTDLNRKITDFQKNAVPVRVVSDATKGTIQVQDANIAGDRSKSLRQVIDLVGFLPTEDTVNTSSSGNPQYTLDRSTAIVDANAVFNTQANTLDSAASLRAKYVVRLQDYIRLLSYCYTSNQEIERASRMLPAGTFYRYAPTGGAFATHYKGKNNSGALGSQLLEADAMVGEISGSNPAANKEYQTRVSEEVGKFLNRFFFAGNAGIDNFYASNPESLGGNITEKAERSGLAAGASAAFQSIDQSLYGLPSTAYSYASDAYSFATSGWENIKAAILLIPAKIAELFVDVVKLFWIPMIATIAHYLFNFVIEFYVYILWLAYPFWFYKKTEKAFTGAMDTLISQAFTAATFCLLMLMFESFAGALIRSVAISTGSAVIGGLSGAIGAAGAGLAGSSGAVAATAGALGIGTAAAGAVVVGAAATAGALFALAFGFAIFYMVGTFLCLRIAPKIFAAFKEGSSVVTPMISAASTALVTGAIGGIIGGAMAGTAAAKTIGPVAGSNVAQGVGSGIKGAAKWARSKLPEMPAGDPDAPQGAFSKAVGAVAGSVARGAVAAGQYIANSPTGKIVRKMGGPVASAVGTDISNMGSAIKTKAENFAADPTGRLAALAQGKMAAMLLVLGSGLSGKADAAAKNLAIVGAAQSFLGKRDGGGASAPGRSDDETPAPTGTQRGSSGGGGQRVINPNPAGANPYDVVEPKDINIRPGKVTIETPKVEIKSTPTSGAGSSNASPASRPSDLNRPPPGNEPPSRA